MSVGYDFQPKMQIIIGLAGRRLFILAFRLSVREDAEVHAAVCPVLNESGHILKAACKRRQTRLSTCGSTNIDFRSFGNNCVYSRR